MHLLPLACAWRCECPYACVCSPLFWPERYTFLNVPDYSHWPIPFAHPSRYTLASNATVCIPSCSTSACIHGTCTAPDVCTCDVGWYGSACDRDCLCNDHSNCTLGPGQCATCIDGSVGPFCRNCQSGYFGNGTRGAAPYSGACALCIDACNGRTSNCKVRPPPVCFVLYSPRFPSHRTSVQKSHQNGWSWLSHVLLCWVLRFSDVCEHVT